MSPPIPHHLLNTHSEPSDMTYAMPGAAPATLSPSSAFSVRRVLQTFSRSGTARKSALFRVGQCLSPYPPRYRTAFAFSGILLPAPPTVCLAVSPARIFGQRYGFTTFRNSYTEITQTCSVRRRSNIHVWSRYRTISCPLTFWSEPVSLLACSPDDAANIRIC